MLIVVYLGDWLSVTIAAYAAGRRLTDRESPAAHPLIVSVVPSKSRSSVGIVA
jgi:hypothetical protein